MTLNYQQSKKAPNLRSFVKRDPHLAMKKKYSKNYEEYRQKWADAGDCKIITNFPIHLDVDIVDSCNLACQYCPQSALEGWTGFNMEKEVFSKIIKEANKQRLFAINIGWNSEALANPKLFMEFLDILDKSSIMDIFIHTNALNFTNEIQDRILKSKIKTVCFSLGEVKDRGKNLKIITERIINFKKKRNSQKKEFPFIRIGIIPTPNNKKEIQEYVDFWKKYADIIELQDVTIVKGKEGEDYKNRKFFCNNPWRRLAISPKGDIFPCCGFTHFSRNLKLGNVRNMSLKEAWQSLKIKELRKGLKENNLENYQGCKDCLLNLYSIDVDVK